MNNTATVERYILSAFLNFGFSDCYVSQAIYQLSPHDFSDPAYRAIYEAIVKVNKDGLTLDIVAVGSLVGDELTAVIIDLMDEATTSANLLYHVRMLKEQRQRERVSAAVSNAIKSDNFLFELSKIVEFENDKTFVYDKKEHFKNDLAEAVKTICEPLDNSRRIGSGFIKLDKTTGKFEKGTVSLIGAYPSCGKTAFGINIINHNLRYSQHFCLFFSLEMLTRQIFERMASDRCRIPYGNIRGHCMTDEERQKMGQYYAYLAQKDKLVIVDNIYYIEDICRTISDMRPDYVLIDFLHCVRTSKRCESRRTEIDYISQSLKECAKRNDCHIIVLCQLTRPEKGTTRPPRMGDLKESGGLEQDGDYIILLNRPYVLDKTADETEAHVLIDKNKYGDTGQIDFTFNGNLQQFVERVM